MIRDPGPIHNIGYSVTSRDLPVNTGESEGDAPNSGYIARALNGHPIMRFFAVSAATLVGTHVASQVVRKGGLKLGKFIQDQADAAGNEANFATRVVKSITELRRHLDELEGFHRFLGDDVDPYSKLVFEQEGKLTTGYSNIRSTGYAYPTGKDKQEAARKFLTNEPASVWTFRDQVQQNLVRAGRRLPYELPAMYATQKAVIEPLMGERENDKRKVKWYNPADVIADFTTTSLTNIATMTIPFEVAGAAAASARSSLHTLRYSMNDMQRMTSTQKLVDRTVRDVSDLLTEVGHDFAKVTNKLLRTSSQLSASFTAVADHYKGQSDFVQNLFSLRHGVDAARKARAAVIDGKKEFQLIGLAHDALEGSIAFNKALGKVKGFSDPDDARRALEDAMGRVRRQHDSRLTSFARGLHTFGRGGVDSPEFKQSEFYRKQREDSFKDLLQQKLVDAGVDSTDAQLFVYHAKVIAPNANTSPGRIVSVGRDKIIKDDDQHFVDVLFRFGEEKNSAGFINSITPGDLKKAVEDARDVFANDAFQQTLHNRISRNFEDVYRKKILQISDSVIGSKKPSFEDFVQIDTPEKKDFLRRKVAQKFGIKLLDDEGFAVDDSFISREIAKRGVDPNDFVGMRGFLVRNRSMSLGLGRDGYNIFGFKKLEVEEAIAEGRFSHLPEAQQRIIGNLASRRGFEDPIPSAYTKSTVDGVYKTRSGQVLDFTAVKSTVSRFGNFLASDFKIPILNFNPADLFGYKSFSEMRNRSAIEYVSSRSVQPFVPQGEVRPDFYIFSKTRGTKGRLIAFNETASGLTSETLPGFYRGVPTSSDNLWSRHTRFASGNKGKTADQREGTTATSRFKRFFSIDADQPNSLFGALKRFAKRKDDINNPSFLGTLLRDADSLNLGPDELKAIDALRKRAERYGFGPKIMTRLEELFPESFTYGGRRLSEIKTPQELLDFTEEVIGSRTFAASEMREAGMDPTRLHTATSRLTKMIEDTNLAATSKMSEYSPTITTRFDELKNELFSYIAQKNQINLNKDGNDIFVQMIQAIEDLKSSGVINAAEQAEAQAAGLAVLFNFSAFKTFNDAQSNLSNAKAAAEAFLELRTGAQGLLDPFAEGTINQISGSIRKRFTPLLGRINKNLTYADYDPVSSLDPIGSGQQLTMVPTFGTVFGRDPFAAITSALGINTYKNTKGFSGASIPASQGIERLNRYFGSVGLGLDVNDFSGPLDLFASGMVGKRVLPLYAAGVTALTIDRTMGGMVNEEDERGERVYSPLILGSVARGAVEAQSIGAGLIPGGMSYQEKREQLLEGEVAIRQGRFWPLGNQPFRGGKVMYFRPSWYRRLESGAMFTSDTYGSPMEKFLFYNDISPLRPLDPYRFERKHYEDRPYPVTGEYFTGPFGPMVPLANATIGKILKPQVLMHEEEVAQGLASYVPAGPSGAYDPSGYGFNGYSVYGNQTSGAPGSGVGAGMNIAGGGQIGASNAMLASRAGPTGMATGMATTAVAEANAGYLNAAYGPPKVSKIMNPRIVPAGEPLTQGSVQYQSTEFGYRSQEMLGIYGFGFGTLREKFGFGQSDFQPQRAVLQSASKAYGSSRSFWDLNLGGLGDVPLAGQDGIGNIEFSEIVRRFIPKERTDVDFINPIENLMGKQYPWLPGAEYYTDFTRGDPFTKVSEGEMRLPGVAYERLNRLYSDETGRYGLINQLDILGDVAPYSQQYKAVNAAINKKMLTPDEKMKVDEIRSQVEQTTTKHEFSEYTPNANLLQRTGEFIAHSDNFVLNKIFGKRTALEDWERNNVYGSTFPEWQTPVDSYIKPMVNKATQNNPLIATVGLAAVGSLFGRTPRARMAGTAVGGITGAMASMYGNVKEALTGERYIPKERKKELALEEYSDILTYVKNVNLSNQARQSGDTQAATQFKMAAGRTMYGMNLDQLRSPEANLDMISLAVPKRKREHFKAMINAPVEDREQILSTAGRLERRLYQAAWGMNVEEKPDLIDYFSKHELPDANWEGWSANTNADHVKIKMGQSMGLRMSQMGYYPQQIQEANLANPSYPDFFASQSQEDVTARLKRLMSTMGVNGSVYPTTTPFGSSQMNISAGVG